MSTVYHAVHRYPDTGSVYYGVAFRDREAAKNSTRNKRRKIAFSSCDHWIEEVPEPENEASIIERES